MKRNSFLFNETYLKERFERFNNFHNINSFFHKQEILKRIQFIENSISQKKSLVQNEIPYIIQIRNQNQTSSKRKLKLLKTQNSKPKENSNFELYLKSSEDVYAQFVI